MAHYAHSNHPAIIKRLNRAAGHLKSIVGMIEEERPCAHWIYDHLEPYAVELKMAQARRLEAIASAKKALINDHIDHCLVHAEEGEGPAEAIAQFRAISKYL